MLALDRARCVPVLALPTVASVKVQTFDRNLITFMKLGGGPLTLIVAYQRPPFSTWAVSVNASPCLFRGFSRSFFYGRSQTVATASLTQEDMLFAYLNYTVVVYMITTIICLYCEHTKRVSI